MLIMVFVFGCVQFAFASDDLTLEQYIEKYPVQYYILTKSDHYNGTKNGFYSSACDFEGTPNRVCGFIVSDGTSNSEISFCSDTPWKNVYYSSYGWKSWGGSARKNSDGIYKFGSSTAIKKVNEYLTNVMLFSNYEDAKTYILTGKINNPIYDNRTIEYDETVELPLMAQCQVNGDSFLFNCKQSVAHSDYTIQLSAECRLTPVYSNFASKSYADTKQSYRTNKNEIGKYDNHGVSFNTSFSTSDLLNGVDTSRKALGFKEFYNGIYINLPYEKCTLSEIVFYARNICDNKCSNWVRVTYDLVNETSKYEEIESVTGSDVPSDTKHNNSKYYPDDYLYNDDEAFNSSSNISNTLTNLKSNYTSLANFYKELFSFLPAEIWIILIGLVGTMVIIAIVKFVRG